MITALIATPILWGEEFGWRGYLQLRLFGNRPLLGAMVTGLIWGLWHIPINLRGYNFPDHPVLGMLVFTVSTTMLSIIFGWLRIRTGSIWPASLDNSNSATIVSVTLSFSIDSSVSTTDCPFPSMSGNQNPLTLPDDRYPGGNDAIARRQPVDYFDPGLR